MSKGDRIRKERMSAEKPTQEEIAGLLNGLQQNPDATPRRKPNSLEIACGGSLMLVGTPATITLKDEREFYVTDIQGWGYTPFGILAVGGWTPDVTEDEWESRVFAHDVVHNIKFEKERYEEIIAEIKAEEAAEEGESEEELPVIEVEAS